MSRGRSPILPIARLDLVPEVRRVGRSLTAKGAKNAKEDKKTRWNVLRLEGKSGPEFCSIRSAQDDGASKMPSRQELEDCARVIVDSALKVHRALGPGLLESTYQACLAHELRNANIPVRCEIAMPVRYDGIEIDAGYRVDMLVMDSVIIENKAVQSFLPVHEAQLMTYLKLSGCKLGFLINWNVSLIKDGIKRMVNGL